MTTAIGAYATAALLKARGAITDSVDDTELGKVCDQVNQYIETKTRRVMAPITSAAYLYDGDGGDCLYLPLPPGGTPIGGIRAVSKLEVAPFTGGAYTEVSSSDYFLRGAVNMTGPFELLRLSDRFASGYGCFPRGLATVRVTGTAGWSAIPDDITDVALTAATRAWHSIMSGQTDIAGTDEMGRPVISRFFSSRDYGTLRDYAIDDVLVSG